MDKNLASQNRKIIAIIGPTGSGKTAYALEHLDPATHELVNVDTLQFYRNLEIGNNKGKLNPGNLQFRTNINKKELNLSSWFYPQKPELICWCFNFLSETESISIAEFLQLVYSLFQDIWSRGKTPVLVGGSGMYLTAILFKYNFKAINDTQSQELKAQFANQTAAQLQDYLSKKGIDFSQLNESDRANPRRLQNLALKANQLSDNERDQIYPQDEIQFVTKIIALEPEPEELDEKLRSRVAEMLDQGLVTEVSELLKKYSIAEIASQIKTASGYQQVLAYFSDAGLVNGSKSNQLKLLEEILTSHHQLVKKQQRWNKKYLQNI